VAWVDPGELDDHGDRVLRAEAVHVRPEAVPPPDEAGDLPEVGEELELLLDAVDVAAAVHLLPRVPSHGWFTRSSAYTKLAKANMITNWTRTAICFPWPIT